MVRVTWSSLFALALVGSTCFAQSIPSDPLLSWPSGTARVNTDVLLVPDVGTAPSVSLAPPSRSRMVPVPAMWRDTAASDLQSSATYRFAFGPIPEGAGIQFKWINYAARVYLNGTLIATLGSMAPTKPRDNPLLVSLPQHLTQGRATNLISVQVAPLFQRTGINGVITLGDFSELSRTHQIRVATSLGFAMNFLGMAVFLFLGYARRPNEREYLALAIACVLMAVWVVTENEHWYFLLDSWHWKLRVRRAAILGLATSGPIFLSQFTFGQIPGWMRHLSVVSISLGLLFLIPGVPIPVLDTVHEWAFLWVEGTMLVCTGLMLLAVRQRRRGSYLLLAGLLPFLLTSSLGLLYGRGLISFLAPVEAGFLAMLLFFSAAVWVKHRDARVQHATLFEAAPDAILAVDSSGRVVEANAAARNLLVPKFSELIGRSLSEAMAPAPEALLQWIGAMEAGQPLPLEMDFPSPAGGRILSLRSTQLPSGGALLIGRDLTEWRAANERLTKRYRLETVGLLASGIAHDFNNLLGTVSLATDELCQATSEAVRRRSTDAIRLASERGRELVNRLLSVSSDLGVLLEPTAPAALIKRLREPARTALPSVIRLELSAQENLPPVALDRVQMEQVLLNLVLNARDALEDSGEVRITVRLAQSDEEQIDGVEQAVVFLVEDDGPGFPDNASPFEAFHTTKTTGLGLGLSMAQAVVRAHGGHILLNSEPGEGSLFRICLPSTTEPAQSHSSLPRIAPHPDAHPVLLVDDEAPLLALMSEILKAQGLSVLAMESPEQALAALEEQDISPSCAILDLALPGMHGLELLAILRQTYTDLPAVIISGYFDPATRDEIQGMDRTTLLSKPFRTPDLLSAIRRISPEGITD